MGKITSLTPEEIRELETTPSDVVRQKIEATGSQEALEAFDEFVALFNMVHDAYLMQANAAESALHKEVGSDKYMEYMYPFFVNGNKGMIEGYWDKPFKERLLFAINATRTFHNCKMKILGEDDKKVWYAMEPCGAGQKLWDAGLCQKGCGLIDDPHPITAGGKNFPVYCTHAPLAELVASEMNTAYIYQQDYPEQVGPCSCIFNVYKNIEDIPQSYFDRIGKKRPE